MQKKDSLLLVLLIGGAVAFFGLYLLSPDTRKQEKSSPSGPISSPRAQDLLNRHLWMTAQNQELAQRKRALENSYQSPLLGQSIWPRAAAPARPSGVDHSSDRHENQAYHDLNRHPQVYQGTSPDHVIQQKLADDQRTQEYALQYQKEYARQFIENARLHGYEVELDSNFVVIQVRAITRPTRGSQAQ
jgi:hypothetical protein